MLKIKRGQISANVFIYALALVVIGIILIMGYKYISTIKDKISDTDLILLKNKLTNDIESISTDFGSSKKVTYSLPPLTKLCLVDLREEVRSEILGSDISPLIKDSVNSNIKKNAFIIGNLIFESYYIGEIELNKPPYFICPEQVSGKIDFTITGRGNRTLI